MSVTTSAYKQPYSICTLLLFKTYNEWNAKIFGMVILFSTELAEF